MFVHACVSGYVRPSRFVVTTTSTFINGFQKLLSSRRCHLKHFFTQVEDRDHRGQIKVKMVKN